MIEKKDNNGWTALHTAARSGQLDTVLELLAAKADIFSEDNGGWLPLHLAAVNGHEKVIEAFIQHDKRCLERTDKEGRTALHRASFYGCHKIVEFLLQKNAAIESTDYKYKTPLHSAAGGYGNIAVIKSLLKYKANIEAKTDFGWTPLHSAARYSDEETVQFLISQGANIEATNNYGETPLLLVLSEAKMDVAKKIAFIKLLLTNKANINAKDNVDRTSLHWACIKGEIRLVELLLKNNLNLEATDKEGKTPLYHAAKEGYKEIVNLLTQWKNNISFFKNPTVINIRNNIPASSYTIDQISKEECLPIESEDEEFSDELDFTDSSKESSQVNTNLSQINLNNLFALLQQQTIAINKMGEHIKVLTLQVASLTQEQKNLRQEIIELKQQKSQFVTSNHLPEESQYSHQSNFLRNKK